MSILGVFLIVLVLFLVFVAWRNNWDWSAVWAALAAAAAAAWEILMGGLPA
ncbi:MAG: hypothetical protein Q8R92_08700 [Deltaproteobacteria bacterium]|nr:hypothetical protein [Deltaproteobacteria bacterium]